MSINKSDNVNKEYLKDVAVLSKIDIKKVMEDTVKSTVKELRVNRLLKEGTNYTKKVELLLYNYETLKEAVIQKEEDIKYLEKHGMKEKSKSVVFYQSGGREISKEDKYIELKESYKRDIQETERNIKKIENALGKIKKDKYYRIIELKYLNPEEKRMRTDEEVAEEIGVDRKTIIRNRKRLLNKLIIIFFPESIGEIM